jgi:hypothetical protein
MGVDVVLRLNQNRKTRAGRLKRLGPKDWLIRWNKEARPTWMSQEDFEDLPETLILRQVEFECRVPGWRTERMIVITTLSDAEEYPLSELAKLYRRRWEIETDLHHLKVTMGMDVLACRSPRMVRQELWANVLGYNLIRTIMWDAGRQSGVPALQISLKGAVQELVASWPYGAMATNTQALRSYYELMLANVALHKIRYRPNRCEPRVRKRRPKNYRLMTRPRAQYKMELLGEA